MIAARIARFRRAIGRSWFLPSFLILFGLSLSWVLASPVGAVPDEPAHSIKAAAVARGQLLGTQTGTDGPLLAVEVPRYIAQVNDMSCFAREVDKTPRCASELGGNSDEMVTAVTTAGLYNPVYYAIIGWPSLTTSGLKAFYVMRICSAFLSCLFLASAFGAVSLLARRKWALVTLSVAITPMVLFLNGAVNPNSLEYATTAAIAANLLLLLERTTSDRLPVVPILVTTAAAALLANTKALSLLWLLVVVVAVAITATSAQLRRLVTNPAVLAGAAFIGLSSVMAIMWILRHDSLSSKPPNTGPIAIPMPKIADQMAMAVARSRCGKLTLINESVEGMMKAPAMPRKAREPMSINVFGENAAPNEPIPNITRPICSARLRPKRSLIDPIVINSAAKTKV